MVGLEKKYKKVYSSGKRKTAIVKAIIKSGNGKILFNGKNYETLQIFDKLRLIEPIKIAKHVLGKVEFDVTLHARGGGDKSQIDAARLALAKCLIKYTQSEELKKAFQKYDRNLLTADVRYKEAYKPGDSKARAMRQSSKR